MTTKQTNTKKPTPKPRIPSEAEAEIMKTLSRNMRISTEQIVAILEKHDVCGDDEKLQRSYRRRVGQRLMASIRDEDGKRELFAAPSESGGNEYVIVEGCNDVKALKDIRNRLQRSMAGLDASAGKVRKRIGFLERFTGFVPPRRRKRKR